MILRGDLQPMAMYNSERLKKRIAHWGHVAFWSMVNCVCFYGCIYTISEWPIPGVK